MKSGDYMIHVSELTFNDEQERERESHDTTQTDHLYGSISLRDTDSLLSSSVLALGRSVREDRSYLISQSLADLCIKVFVLAHLVNVLNKAQLERSVNMTV